MKILASGDASFCKETVSIKPIKQVSLRTKSAESRGKVRKMGAKLIKGKTDKRGVSSQNKEHHNNNHRICFLERNHGLINQGHAAVCIRRGNLKKRKPSHSTQNWIQFKLFLWITHQGALSGTGV